MANVLYIMYGMPSCYNSGFSFARRFIASGIHTTIACDKDINEMAQRAKVPFRYLRSISASAVKQKSSAINHRLAKSHHRKVNRVIQLIRERLALRRQTLADDELLQVIQELKPDVLLIDIECHLAIIASSKLGIPTALCSRLFDHRPNGFRPPLHSNIAPSNKRSVKLRIAMHWWKLRAESFLIAMRQHVSRSRLSPIHYRSFRMPDIKAIARQHDVNLSSIATTAHWFRPLTYKHAPIYSFTLKALDYERIGDNQFTYLGPMIDDQDYVFDVSHGDTTRIEHFITQSKSANKKIIYCAMGTYARREPRFAEVIRSISESRSDFAFIVSLGGRESANDYAQFPSNTLLIDVAPQLYCLAHADAAILHAGIASLQEAIKYKVPHLIFSVGSNDQNGTATRWTNNGLATRFSLSNATAETLVSELDSLLVNTNLKNQLERYSLMVKQSAEAPIPENILKELLK